MAERASVTTGVSHTEHWRVEMLVRRGRPCGEEPIPGSGEVAHAISLLRKFQFVGITEYWDLTVCLWHTRFGGADLPYFADEFHNTRPGSGPKDSSGGYDTSVLHGFVDSSDRPLYAAALRLFNASLDFYNISFENCENAKLESILV